MADGQPVDSADAFQAYASGPRSQEVWDQGEHAVIGVSAGNSYFTQDRLAGLLRWAARHFATIDVIYTDVHIDTMLVALGNDAGHAAKLAKSQIRDVRRRTRRAVERLGASAEKVRMQPMSSFFERAEYQAVRSRVGEAVDASERLATACKEMVHHFLDGREVPGERVPHVMGAGLEYLLAELPFFVDSPGILGVGSSAVCYHVSTPIVEYFKEPDHDVLSAAPNQGYLVVRPAAWSAGADA
ncbi:tRNA-dependent cyclodipeptide synthase [Streptomyces catenulae]|uniref:Cyclodipeptide synthase n=1 Tax=Streptomyces catenulae TaxID=66875 RepID=A0ABV2Z596_9ACTN|nr:tRNA-dependent cyclodipeptide synthase [Streptomyces catenulae]